MGGCASVNHHLRLPRRRAFAPSELGAGWAFRQSLVDLASVCGLLAAELPTPRG